MINSNPELAQQAKQEKIAWAKANLKLDWEDLPHWKSLSSKYGFRLPSYYQPGTETRYLKRLMKHCNVDMNDYLESCGVRTVKELVCLNPTHPAFVFCGFALEWVEGVKNGNQ